MTVENPDVLDQVTKSEDGSVYTLDMIETRPFDASRAQLEQLVAKINSYIEAIQTGRLLELYPEMRGSELKVRLVCMHEPQDGKLVDVLGAATKLFAKHGADFAVHIIPPELMRHNNGQGD